MQRLSLQVLREKYARRDEHRLPGAELIDAIHRRIAASLAAIEAQPARCEAQFLQTLRAGFIPAGRIAHALGTAGDATAINCFVQPLAGEPAALKRCIEEAMTTLAGGGGVGYDFSVLPPAANRERQTPTVVELIDDLDARTRGLTGVRGRHAAQMGVLRVDHPDIIDFIDMKRAAGRAASFNLSVAVTDDFMTALATDADIALNHGLSDYGRVSARELWQRTLAAAYDSAEPGVLFIDRINRENTLAGIEAITATNPCGEQPLPAYGACCLGSIDLTRFVVDPFSERARFEVDRFAAVAATAVRMLDNVLEASRWPLPAQRREAIAKRRIGLGFTGLADALFMLGDPYDSDAGRARAVAITEQLRDAAWTASCALAQEKGPFPLCEPDQLLATPYALRLPGPLRRNIATNGVRNSHLLSIAPTGSISLAFADNVSTGIEPIYRPRYQRRHVRPDGTDSYAITDHACRLYRALHGRHAPWPETLRTALDIAPADHIAMEAALTPLIDAGISKTVNVEPDCPFERFRDIYDRAWREGLKGITVFRRRPGGESVLYCCP